MHPNSLKNLQPGKLRTKAKCVSFKLSQAAIDYLSQFKNMTAEIERLIAKEIQGENNGENS